MDVPSAGSDEPNPEVPDYVPELDLACTWCKVRQGARYDADSGQILCGTCAKQWPLVFHEQGNDPSKA